MFSCLVTVFSLHTHSLTSSSHWCIKDVFYLNYVFCPAEVNKLYSAKNMYYTIESSTYSHLVFSVFVNVTSHGISQVLKLKVICCLTPITTVKLRKCLVHDSFKSTKDVKIIIIVLSKAHF